MKSWEIFLNELEKEIGRETVERWLKPLQIISFDAANLYLSAENSFQIDWFEEHIRSRLKGKFLNNNYRPITVHLTTEKSKTLPPSRTADNFTIHSQTLDPEFTLETFIVRDENRLAHQLIKEIEKKTFNPLFIYGPSRSGKTHLLSAAAHLFEKKGVHFFFTSANQFTEHVVSAIRLQKMREFRKVYREIDVLIVDDIETLKGRAATQEEFFHTFNTLHTAGKQIILSAGCSTAELADIEPRLISRFEWGISLPIGRIDPRPILEVKAAHLWDLNQAASLIEWLAISFPTDPLSPFHALSLRTKGDLVTIDAAKILLKDFLEKEQEQILTPEKIIKTVAGHYGIRSEDLLGKSQTKEIATPRKAAMYLCREKLKLPFKKIGEIFDRDHSTVITSIDQIQKSGTDRVLDHLKF